MRLPYRRTAVSPVVFLVLFFFSGCWGQAQSQKVVSFPTEDGLTITATLHLPAKTAGPIAGVVMVAEPTWILRSTYDTSNLARDLAKKYGMASVTVDLRGTGASLNGRHFKTYSPEELDKVQLDIRGALKFLGSQDGVDPHRIGIVAVGEGANYAVLEAASNTVVQAVVLLSGKLSEKARGLIQRRGDIPFLFIAGKDDKESFREMSEAFYSAKNLANDILLTVGHGTVMFSHTAGLADKVEQWLADNVKSLGTEAAVNFTSSDGWNLHGRVFLPDGASESSKVPGVVFVHGAMHDQETYYDLARLAVRKGMAVLTFDWRGKNRTLNEGKGNYGVDLAQGEELKIYLDIKAAIQFLASQKPIDTTRMGIVAATMPTNQAMQASIGDSRIKTIVILTQYILSPEAKQFLTTSDVPIFFIASSEDLNFEVGSLADSTREAYRLSQSKLSEFLLYDDAGRGSEMLKEKDELQPMIIRWLSEKLAK